MKSTTYLFLLCLLVFLPLNAQRAYQTASRYIGIEQIDTFKSFLAIPNDAAKKEQIEANINWAEQQL